MTETEAGRDPEQGTGPDDAAQEQSGHSTGYADTEGRSGIDTGGVNEDLHGQAREVEESAKSPGASETPAG